MTAPRRRWFRFSLPTMFVGVTVCACWLGYQLNWIHERRRMVAAESTAPQGEEEVRFYKGGDFTGLSAWRRWLGDQPVPQVVTGFPPATRDGPVCEPCSQKAP